MIESKRRISAGDVKISTCLRENCEIKEDFFLQRVNGHSLLTYPPVILLQDFGKAASRQSRYASNI